MRRPAHAYRGLLLALGLIAPARAVTLNPSAPAVAEGQSLHITADAPVVWSLASGSAGKIQTNSDGSVTYTAPPSVTPQNLMAGCPILPNDTVFSTRVDQLPLHPQSANWTNPANIGINGLNFQGSWGISVADASTPTTQIKTYYGSSSWPNFVLPTIPALKRECGALTTDQPAGSSVDHHVLTVRKTDCSYWEIYNNYIGGPRICQDGTSGCTATSAIQYPWSNYQNRGGTDAAGFPLAPMTLRLDEMEAGAIHHPLRFTSCTGCIYGNHGVPFWPAAGTGGAAGSSAPPYGARFRLKASYDISKFSPMAQAVLTALKQYGLFLGDIGSEESISIGTDVSQDPAAMGALGQIQSANITMDHFEAVDESALMVSPTSYEVKPNNGYEPVPVYAQLTATPLSGGAALTVPIAIQGVGIGLPSPEINVMAGLGGQQLSWWVTGAANQGVSWSLVSGAGSVTSAGVYTPPPTQAPGTTSSALLKGTSAADSNAVTYLKIIVLPNGANPSGSIRIDTGAHQATTDKNGNVWLSDQAFETGLWVELNGDYPGWAAQSDPLIAQYQSSGYNYGNDITYSFLVPNGNYRIHLMFGMPWDGCKVDTCGPTFDPQGHAPLQIEANGQVALHGYDFGASINYARATPVDTYIPVQVTNNSLYIALRAVNPDGTSRIANSPELNGLEVLPDTSAPHITVDPSSATVTFNQTLQLNAVGWYMSNAASWKILSGPGSLTAGGLYSPPVKPVFGSVPVKIQATSLSDPSQTATASLNVTMGAISVSPSAVRVVRQMSLPFAATIAGLPYTNVRWSVSPAIGTIDASGVYTAPPTLAQDTNLTVTATSLDDPSHVGNASLTVTALPSPIRIQTGDNYAPITDESGNVWSTDYGYTTSRVTHTSVPVAILGASPKMQPLYNSERYCYAGQSFQYNFSLPDGQYWVTLKFADSSYAGQSVPPHYLFDVDLNGVAALHNFDLDAAARTPYTAVDRTFRTTVSSQTMTINIIASSQSAAVISGIQILPFGWPGAPSAFGAGQPLAPNVYPNPWRSDKYTEKRITFDLLPDNADILIFTVSGHKVRELSGSSRVNWDLTNEHGDLVASGLYVYLVKAPDGRKARGELAIAR